MADQGKKITGILGPGHRLDRLLTDYCAALDESALGKSDIILLSRTRIKNLIEAGHLTLNAQIVTDPSAKIGAATSFELVLPPPDLPKNQGENIDLVIIHEDDDVLVIDKPPGMVVHPAPGHRQGTLVNALIHHCGSGIINVGGVARPGIVHRLDKDTSGILVVAKNDRAYAVLQQQFAEHTIERCYVTLVWGLVFPKHGTISHSIGRSPINRQKMAVVQKGGKKAVTHYRRLQNWGGKPSNLAVSLLECRLETGRTHQIRVHLAHFGHAVIGDPIYGRKRKENAIIKQVNANNLRQIKFMAEGDKAGDDLSAIGNVSGVISEANLQNLAENLAQFGRQALHAAKLGFYHPKNNEYVEFNSNPPEDFLRLLRMLNQEEANRQGLHEVGLSEK